jgi:hypothetical protein
MDNRLNVMGMQGERSVLSPVLEAEYPAALEWSHNWTPEQVVEVLAALGKGRTSKAKRAARTVLAGKLAEINYAIR